MGDWRHHAACRDEDPELFFPIGTSGPALLQVEQAKEVCRRCAVSDECLRWAVDTGQDAGVWGGMSEEERRAFRRRSVPARPAASRRLPDADDADVLALLARRVPIRDWALARRAIVILRSGPDKPNNSQIAARIGATRQWVECRVAEINKAAAGV
jgi:WhiB family redox-sensing transcriptional regulator